MRIIYSVEPIEIQRPPVWGDLDPATKELRGTYKGKTKGACRPEDSTITEANGFRNIEILPPGASPNDVIAKRIAARLSAAKQ